MHLTVTQCAMWYFTNTLDLQGDDTRIIILVNNCNLRRALGDCNPTSCRPVLTDNWNRTARVVYRATGVEGLECACATSRSFGAGWLLDVYNSDSGVASDHNS